MPLYMYSVWFGVWSFSSTLKKKILYNAYWLKLFLLFKASQLFVYYIDLDRSKSSSQESQLVYWTHIDCCNRVKKKQPCPRSHRYQGTRLIAIELNSSRGTFCLVAIELKIDGRALSERNYWLYFIYIIYIKSIVQLEFVFYVKTDVSPLLEWCSFVQKLRFWYSIGV